VTVHWLRRKRGPAVYGCDIDPDTIKWCRQNLHRGRFVTNGFEPPLPYPDGHFDVATGYSVFTHLHREAQRAWLAEMRRVVAPGGLLVTSVCGPSAAWFTFGDRTAEALRDGIHDATPDRCVSGVIPEGTYRLTYQTVEYTRKVFGEFFEILEYTDFGIGNHQDLVVLRRPT
jgi:SAM-dependent methyltransferase